MSGKLSGERWNGIIDGIVERYIAMRDGYVDALMESGYPPGTQPLTPFEQYQKLLSMRAVDDPNYTDNPRAQAALARLALRFGEPPPLQVAVGQQMPDRPATLLGATQAAQKLGGL